MKLAGRLDGAGLDALGAALADPGAFGRYLSKMVAVPGSSWAWWTGAISGRGQGRFSYSRGRVVIAHRFGFGLVHGAGVLDSVRVLGHRCDNALCQRVHPDHVVASSFEANRREFLVRRDLIGSPLGDPRGARRRARELRDLARVDPGLVAVDLARLRDRYGEQMPLW